MIYFTALYERASYGEANRSMNRVFYWAGAKGYGMINMPAARVDVTRNKLCMHLKEQGTSDDDALVMLDYDHEHDPYAIENLSAMPSKPFGVVAGLAYNRGNNHEPLVYDFIEEGKYQLVDVAPHSGIMRIDNGIVAPCVMMIRRWVLDILPPLWWQYKYGSEAAMPWATEDVYFCRLCHEYNIPIYVNTDVLAPHLAVTAYGAEAWEKGKIDIVNKESHDA